MLSIHSSGPSQGAFGVMDHHAREPTDNNTEPNIDCELGLDSIFQNHMVSIAQLHCYLLFIAQQIILISHAVIQNIQPFAKSATGANDVR